MFVVCNRYEIGASDVVLNLFSDVTCDKNIKYIYNI